ncbi:MAG TPA: DUF4142 domain-containing protein [Ohtaekwangia sp.]|nr:DUF4142 domain-containing protein [Ohtaekwangia sp.]
MKTKLWIYGLLFSSLMMWTACDDDDNNDDNDRSVNDADETFVEKAALSNMTEIEFGQLAVEHGQSAEVRDFGQHMIDEHTTAQNELRNIADDIDDIDWPDDMDQHHRTLQDQLLEKEGYSFDSMYMATQVVDHENAQNLFQSQATNGTDEQVKSYAAKYLPHIEMHLDEAQDLKDMLMTEGETDGTGTDGTGTDGTGTDGTGTDGTGTDGTGTDGIGTDGTGTDGTGTDGTGTDGTGTGTDGTSTGG